MARKDGAIKAHVNEMRKRFVRKAEKPADTTSDGNGAQGTENVDVFYSGFAPKSDTAA